MNQKIPFHELSSRIAAATGISEDSAEIFVKNFFDIISDELIKGETVKIKGLGEFSLYEEKGEKTIGFVPDRDLAEAINAPFAMFESVTLNDEVTEAMLTEESLTEESSIEETAEKESDSVEIVETHETTVPESMPTVTEPESETVSDHSPENIAETTVEIISEAPAADELTPQKSSEPVKTEVSASVSPATPQITPLEEEPEVFVSAEEYDEEQEQSSGNNFWMGFIIGIVVGLAVGACGVYLAIDHLFPGGRQQAATIESVEPIIGDDLQAKDEMQPSDTVTTMTETPPEPESVEQTPAAAPATPVETSATKATTDTIRRGYLIHDMAKKFFGSKDYWVYIYEENKSKIGNPNNMQPGLVLSIPSTEKYGIIPGDAESLKKARQKAGEILAKYPR